MPYVGLDGVRGGKINPRGKHFARSISGVMTILRKGRVCSSAGDNGAVTVWRDDAGFYRCDFSRWGRTINCQTVASKAAVRRWLADWMPKMDEAADSRGKNA